jgi:predicted DNA-binding ribbon-helix-helix protein
MKPDLADLLPDTGAKPNVTRSSITLPDWLWARIHEITEADDARLVAEGRLERGRDGVLAAFLTRGVKEWDAARGPSNSKKQKK